MVVVNESLLITALGFIWRKGTSETGKNLSGKYRWLT
jgi:hypothetical protein